MTNLLRQPIFRHLWRASGLVPLWAGFVVVIAALTLVVSISVDVDKSAWEMASQLPPWFMFALGVYATTVYLPVYITHGHTRKEFLSQAAVWVLLLSAGGAALMTLTFGIERLVYDAAGWTQGFDDDFRALYTAPDDYGWIFLAFWLNFLSYTTIGALMGAAFYGQAWKGMAGVLMVPVALALTGAAGLVTNGSLAWLPELLNIESANGVAITVSVLACATAATITWAFVRDIPVRPNVP
jgi:hypothetical protein